MIPERFLEKTQTGLRCQPFNSGYGGAVRLYSQQNT